MINHEYEVPLPGMYIQEELDAREWSQRDLAFILGIEEAALNKVIKGKIGISTQKCRRHSRLLSISMLIFFQPSGSPDLRNSAAPDPATFAERHFQTNTWRAK